MRAISLLAAVFFLSVAQAQPLPDDTYIRPARLVTVDGGRRINLVCMGEGAPTVLFDSGLATAARTWRLVQGEVAKVTRACAYDRAGIGFSDPRGGASDTKSIVADIHALLRAAGIRTPILYVGHSMSGLAGLLLQATHPEDVAGEVLVDPSFADQFQVGAAAAIAAGAPPAMRQAALDGYRRDVARLRACATLPAPLPGDCAGDTPGLSPALTAFLKAQESRPSYLDANASEYESMLPLDGDRSVDQRELDASPPNFGGKPLIVLTAGRGATYPGLTPAQNAAMQQSWMAGHDRLAALSTRGSNTLVPNSAHTIQHDQPQAVIDAIDKAIAQIRAR